MVRFFVIPLLCFSSLALPVLTGAEEVLVTEPAPPPVVEESLPIAPQSFDGYDGVPQTAFAPRPGEVIERNPAAALVGPQRIKPGKAVKTYRKQLKNLRVAR